MERRTIRFFVEGTLAVEGLGELLEVVLFHPRVN
jgi:hypothetical protein